MALNFNYMDTYIKRVYMPKVHEQILGSNPSLYIFLGKAKMQRGGSPIDINYRYLKNISGGPYTRWQQATISYRDKVTKGYMTWRYNRKFITLDHIDELENAGEGKVVSLIDDEVTNAKLDFMDDLGTQIFSLGTEDYGTGAGLGITGLRAAIDDSTVIDIYATIQRSVYTWMKSQYDYNGGVLRALTVKLMQRMWGLCKTGVDSTDTVKYIFTTQDLFDKYAGMLDVSRQRGDEELGKAGFQNLLFMGKPYTVDSHCPDEYMFFVNTDHVYMYIHPDENFVYVPFAKQVDSETAIAKIRFAGQLVNDDCRKSGVIRKLDDEL